MDSDSSSTEKEILQDDLIIKQLSKEEKHALRNYDLKSLHQKDYISLHLEFKNIVKMDFVHEFTSLVRLDLNNNLIEKIWGLDHLINLTWLNLSFNKIENIEGLESLRKLELLNLSHNKVSLLENMDTLEYLSHFFISKNLIKQKESVLYLRRFKSLFKLSIAGNPFTKKDNHSLYVAAFLPNVTILDNILISPKMRDEASVKYQLELKKFKLQEFQEQPAEGFEQNLPAQLKIHEDAFMDNIMSSSDDAEATRPDCLPGVAPALQTADSQVVELCSQIFATVSAEQKQLQKEMNSFFYGQIETETYYQQRASKILADFEEQHTQRRTEIKKLEDPELQKTKISDCKDEISKLNKSLLTLEFELVRNLDDNIKQLDSYISDMLSTGNDSASQIELQETMDDTQNETDTEVNDPKAALIKEIQEKEEKRNRVRISDIHRYVDYLAKQFEDMH